MTRGNSVRHERDKKMKFFLPAASDPESAEANYLVIRKFVEKHYGPLSTARYHSITFRRRSEICSATVGEIERLARETVIAIFRQANGTLFYICTPNRGIVRDGPLLEGDVLQSEEFKAD
jgi:hypothetical protein